MMSLDEPLADGIGALEAIGENDQGFERTEQRLMLRRGFDELAPREREILRLRFFEGLTQREIADEVGISQMHVSRLIRRSVDALRDTIARADGDCRVIGRHAGKDLPRADDEPAEEADRSDEEQERLNRQMTELLNELRVAMPGVQVLFAFLLAVPFQQRFATVNAFQRDVYLVTLLAAATATAFLIAPSAYHRIAFQEHEKERIIQMGTRQFVCGLVALAVAMNGAVLLVTDVLFQATTVDRRGRASPRSSAGCGSESAYGGDGSDERTRGDPRHRRHARRLQLPAHDRVVPRAAPARPARRDMAHPPPHRHGRRPARGVAVRRRGGGARWARTSAPPRRRSTWRSSTRSSRSTAPAT